MIFYNKKLHIPSKEEIAEFLTESNAIEGVFGEEALEDATKAWTYALTYGRAENPEYLELRVLLRIHKYLMQRQNPRIAGKLRECDVWIGGEHKKFISTPILQAQVIDVLKKINRLEEDPQKAHVLFEGVHPFEDGNGRIGRILYNWQRLNMGLPLHIIHSGEEQQEYYKWFRTKDI